MQPRFMTPEKKQAEPFLKMPAASAQTLGWMVLGLVTEAGFSVSRQVPVLAVSASAAMTLAAAQNVDFRPVGALSENELSHHLQIIGDHRKALAQKN